MLRRPRFKPHLRAEVVPGEGVFLRSEKTHTVLHGRLYELVAPCLDGRPVAEVSARLRGRISTAHLYYTLAQLEQKGYLTENDGSHSPGEAALSGATPCASGFGLAELLKGTERDPRFDPRTIYVSHGPLERFHEITAIPELATPEAFIQNWKNKAKVRRLENGNMKKFDAYPGQLLSLYHQGATLYFGAVEHAIPALQLLADRLADDLRIQRGQVICEVFVSGPGSGIELHFDPYSGFNLQLLGRKTWTLAYNRHVSYPLLHWSVGQDVLPDLADYARLPFPQESPPNAMTFEAMPGTVVYIPHGAWHATVAHEPSLALVFSSVQPTWTSLMLQPVKKQLERIEKWRERPLGLDPLEYRQTLKRLLDELKETVNSLEVESLLDQLTQCQPERHRDS